MDRKGDTPRLSRRKGSGTTGKAEEDQAGKGQGRGRRWTRRRRFATRGSGNSRGGGWCEEAGRYRRGGTRAPGRDRGRRAIRESPDQPAAFSKISGTLCHFRFMVFSFLII